MTPTRVNPARALIEAQPAGALDLPPDVRRALLAISSRPKLSGPVYGAIRAAYKAFKR